MQKALLIILDGRTMAPKSAKWLLFMGEHRMFILSLGLTNYATHPEITTSSLFLDGAQDG